MTKTATEERSARTAKGQSLVTTPRYDAERIATSSVAVVILKKGRLMPNRLPYEIIVAVGLLLGSCSGRQGYSASDAYDLADAAQANSRTALGQNEEQDSKLDDLERKLRDLETELDSRKRMEDAIISDLNTFMDRYNSHTH